MGKDIVYMGFHAIYGFRHPQGSWKISLGQISGGQPY